VGGLFDEEVDDVPDPADEEDEEVEGDADLDLRLHPHLRGVGGPAVVAEDEGIGDDVEGEVEEQGGVPEEPMSEGVVGAPVIVVVEGDRIHPDEECGQDEGYSPAEDVEPVEGYLRFLLAGDPCVEGDGGGPEEGGDEEEVNEGAEDLAEFYPIAEAIVVVEEEGDLADADGETATEVGEGEEEDKLVQGLGLVGKEDVVDDDGCAAEEGETGRGEVEAVELELVFA